MVGGTSTLFVVTTDPNIKSIKDLKGKKVAGKFTGTVTSPGVVKYYKEKGIWTSKHEARQQELLKAAGM